MSRLDSIIAAARESGAFASRVYVGIVVEITPGTQHGPASSYSYKIGINFPSGYQEVDGIVPVQERWDDAVTDVRPLRVPSVVLVADVEGELQLVARELPWTEPCAASRSGPDQEAARIIGAIKSMTPAQRAILRQELK